MSDQLNLLTPPPLPVPASDVPSGASGAGDGYWHHSSGLVLPRGTVCVYPAGDDDLERVAEGSARRGVQAGALLSRKVKRSARDERQLSELCTWLHGYSIDIIGTVTFSDAYASEHGIYSLPRALDDVADGLRSASLDRGRHTGFRGRYVLAGEWHRTGRTVPHIHLALDSMGVADIERLCTELWRHFFASRGRSRFEPMRDADVATLYGLKDTVKASEHDPDCIRLKLGRSKGRK